MGERGLVYAKVRPCCVYPASIPRKSQFSPSNHSVTRIVDFKLRTPFSDSERREIRGFEKVNQRSGKQNSDKETTGEITHARATFLAGSRNQTPGGRRLPLPYHPAQPADSSSVVLHLILQRLKHGFGNYLNTLSRSGAPRHEREQFPCSPPFEGWEAYPLVALLPHYRAQ